VYTDANIVMGAESADLFFDCSIDVAVAQQRLEKTYKI
jgi:hypothetical protein